MAKLQINNTDIITESSGNITYASGTLASGITFPAGCIIKTYYAEYTESNSTTYSIDTWHDIPNLSITNMECWADL